MPSQVIYSRVPQELKDAADGYAADRGVTLTVAVADLLERGIRDVSDEQSVAALEAKISKLSTENARLMADLTSARHELATVAALAKTATRPIGECPSCDSAVNGYDLLSSGKCPNCGDPLSEMLAPSSSTSVLEQRDFLILIGVLGAVVGLALLTSKG